MFLPYIYVCIFHTYHFNPNFIICNPEINPQIWSKECVPDFGMKFGHEVFQDRPVPKWSYCILMNIKNNLLIPWGRNSQQQKPAEIHWFWQPGLYSWTWYSSVSYLVIAVYQILYLSRFESALRHTFFFISPYQHLLFICIIIGIFSFNNLFKMHVHMLFYVLFEKKNLLI